MIPLSLYQQHVESWTDCQKCNLHTGRHRIVLARGKIPCEVLLVGEAPGMSEDILGRPFVGPAGSLLNQIIERAIPSNVSVAMTNLVACFPKAAKKEGTNEPEAGEILACQPRLSEFIGMCLPKLKLVVCVGTLSAKWVRKMRGPLGLENTKLIDVVHPAYILRATIVQRGLLVQKVQVTIANAVEEMSNATI